MAKRDHKATDVRRSIGLFKAAITASREAERARLVGTARRVLLRAAVGFEAAGLTEQALFNEVSGGLQLLFSEIAQQGGLMPGTRAPLGMPRAFALEQASFLAGARIVAGVRRVTWLRLTSRGDALRTEFERAIEAFRNFDNVDLERFAAMLDAESPGWLAAAPWTPEIVKEA